MSTGYGGTSQDLDRVKEGETVGRREGENIPQDTHSSAKSVGF